MGCCLSKKDPILSSNPAPISPNNLKNPSPNLAQTKNNTKLAAIEAEPTAAMKQGDEKPAKKKEVFVIQHRKSNDRRSESDASGPPGPISPDPGSDCGNNKIGNGNGALLGGGGGGVMMTSSCTKEAVDVILIQCGRLSRSSSGRAGVSCENRSGRKYAGSKRSHDFDNENAEDAKRKGCGDFGVEDNNNNNCDEADDERLTRRSESRGSHRRRTPSRSRERDSSQQRSGSRERGMSSGSRGRRISVSPRRRSESPVVTNVGSGNGNMDCMPAKMVSVPATVSSLSNEKGEGAGSVADSAANGNVRRILVRRNVGDGGASGSRGTASPRSQSPARGNDSVVLANESNNQLQHQQQVQTLSRNSSRKAEHSPYRRTPLNDIDMNSLPFQPLAKKSLINNSASKAQQKDKAIDEDVEAIKHHPNPPSQNKCADSSTYTIASLATHRRTGSRGGGEVNEITNINYCLVTDSQTRADQHLTHKYDAVVTPVIISGTDTLRIPQTLTRSRSSRRSRDLDINVEALLNPNATSNYNSLLLQDIQNFHQNTNANSNANPNTNMCTPFTHPPCLSKAYSILEAVADLNSSTSSNLSSTFTDDKQKGPLADFSSGKDSSFRFSANPAGRRRLLEGKDASLLESEVNIDDDLMAPSIHKYVTVRKKGIDDEDQESSGSNSFVGSQLNKIASPSSLEPNSADSTDCWTSSSKSNMRRDGGSSQLVIERLTISEPLCRNDEEPQRKMSKSRRDSPSEQRRGTMRARTANGKGGPHGLGSSMAAPGAST